MTPSQLMREWKKTRDEYFEAVDARDEEVRTLGCGSSEVFRNWEKQTNNKLNRLRAKLAKHFPEMFHYGRMTRNKCRSGAKLKKVCVQGDHGYWICQECSQTFEFQPEIDGNSRGLDKFTCCSEHQVRKVVGKMSLKPVLDWCL